MRGFGSRFQLLLLEGLVFLKHILPQLVDAWREEMKDKQISQTDCQDMRLGFLRGQTRTSSLQSVRFCSPVAPQPGLPCVHFTAPPAALNFSTSQSQIQVNGGKKASLSTHSESSPSPTEAGLRHGRHFTKWRTAPRVHQTPDPGQPAP